ncbi:hypothetical protein V5799_010095 [Amblyomma americanum]|uniref:Uncharacterized protein n=1 Tax=Amblyomma americanum TaxID=6943 RepID=A0AAQ4F8L7_AMBAM
MLRFERLSPTLAGSAVVGCYHSAGGEDCWGHDSKEGVDLSVSLRALKTLDPLQKNMDSAVLVHVCMCSVIARENTASVY